MAIQYTLTISDLAISDLDVASTNLTTPSVPVPAGGGWTLFQSYASFNKIYYVWIKGSDAITVFVNYIMTGQEGPLLVDASSAPVTITLPSLMSTKSVDVKKIDTSGNAVIIIPPSSELIDGQISQTISTPYISLHMVNNATDWFIV